MNLVDLLYRSVQNHPNKACLSYVEHGNYRDISYERFWQLIIQFAHGLSEQGVKPNTRVAILSKNRPEWAISDFAILCLQGVVVPIYPSLPTTQVDFILSNADVEYVIVEDEHQLTKVRRCTNRGLRQVILMDVFCEPVNGQGVAKREEFGRVEDFSVDASPVEVSHENPLLFSQLLDQGATSVKKGVDVIHHVDIPNSQLATIVHTSGTSGRPKGVMLTHGNIVSSVLSSLNRLPVSSSDIALSYLPLSHVFERTVGHFAPLSAGATIAYAESIDTISKNLEQVCPTVLVTVPRLLEKVYARISEQIHSKPRWLQTFLTKPVRTELTVGLTYRLVDIIIYRKLRRRLGNRMRMIVAGGAPLSEKIARFYTIAKIPVYEGYGMTEAAPVIAANPWGKARLGTVGTPLENVEVRLAEDGELLVRGPNVMRGYVRNPTETKNVLEPDGWLHTGDIAQLEDGYVRIIDRKKNILVLATGKNVSPVPIESALELCAHIGSAVVIGDNRKFVAALLVPDFVALQSFLEGHNISSVPEKCTRDSHVVALIQREAEAAIAEFADFEKPKRAILVPREWTVASGELTPTLKIRRKIILENYARAVEEMYEGIAFIPLHQPGSPAATGQKQPTLQATGSEEHHDNDNRKNCSRPRPSWLVRTLAGLAGLFIIIIVSAILPLPHSLNLSGMVRNISQHNKDINRQNQGILGDMASIRQSSSATPVIAQHLTQLNAGINENDTLLQRLDGLSRQEVELSHHFKGLAITMTGDMNSISHSSSEEALSLTALAHATSNLGTTAGQLTSIQRKISAKLSTASADSQKLAQEMP